MIVRKGLKDAKRWARETTSGSGGLKAISLTQPWAELVARGAKKIETRSWSTTYRGPLAIQAAKGWTLDDKRLLAVFPFNEALGKPPIFTTKTMPLGAVVALVDLVDVKPMTPEFLASVGEPERSFGGYSPERFGWILERPRRLATPIPVRGMLGVFELPGPVAAAVREQLAVRGEKTTVVNLHREPYDAYIGRPGRGQEGYFGNPFVDQPLEVYEKHFLERVATDGAFRARVLELRGLRLGCFCKPGRCHGDVIAAWLDGDGARVAAEELARVRAEDFEERAAILEFDAGLSRAEAEARARGMEGSNGVR